MFISKTNNIKSFEINLTQEEYNKVIDEVNSIYTKIPPTDIPVLLALKDLLVGIDNN